MSDSSTAAVVAAERKNTADVAASKPVPPTPSKKDKSKANVVLIHGLFQNPLSWADWVTFFEERDFRCETIAYPHHDGDPKDLRANPDPKLGTLTLNDVVEHVVARLDAMGMQQPIVVGHSMGGLVVQKLVALKRASLGVCISTAPPKGVLSFKWSFLKCNIGTVNPFAGDSICKPSVEWFHAAFTNTMTLEQTRDIYDRLVVYESRNIPRSGTKADGAIDFTRPHAPLLFIAGEADTIIPHSLVEKNMKAYTDAASVKDWKLFPGKTHFICGQDGWEEVAQFVVDWIAAKQS